MDLNQPIQPLPGQLTAFDLEGMDQTDGTDQYVLDLFDDTPEEIKP